MGTIFSLLVFLFIFSWKPMRYLLYLFLLILLFKIATPEGIDWSWNRPWWVWTYIIVGLIVVGFISYLKIIYWLEDKEREAKFEEELKRKQKELI